MERTEKFATWALNKGANLMPKTNTAPAPHFEVSLTIRTKMEKGGRLKFLFEEGSVGRRRYGKDQCLKTNKTPRKEKNSLAKAMKTFKKSNTDIRGKKKEENQNQLASSPESKSRF